jgi:uncharacterized protein (DUF2147 family)
MRVVILSLTLFASTAFAADRTPVGTWKTIDDNSHQAKALVEITEHDGALSGRVTQLFRKPGEDQNPKCADCSGNKHDKPIIGIEILWNLHRDGDEWVGGEILDPDEGKTYRCKMHVSDDGFKLEVRGFIGFSLLGRTQVWERASPQA